MEYCKLEDLVGGEPEVNKQIAIDILKGQKGPKRDIVVLNAAAAIHIATGKSIAEAVKEAEEILDSGKAYEQLQHFVKATNC